MRWQQGAGLETCRGIQRESGVQNPPPCCSSPRSIPCQNVSPRQLQPSPGVPAALSSRRRLGHMLFPPRRPGARSGTRSLPDSGYCSWQHRGACLAEPQSVSQQPGPAHPLAPVVIRISSSDRGDPSAEGGPAVSRQPAQGKAGRGGKARKQ